MKVRRQRGKTMNERKRNKRSKGRHQFLSRKMRKTIPFARKNERCFYRRDTRQSFSNSIPNTFISRRVFRVGWLVGWVAIFFVCCSQPPPPSLRFSLELPLPSSVLSLSPCLPSSSSSLAVVTCPAQPSSLICLVNLLLSLILL